MWDHGVSKNRVCFCEPEGTLDNGLTGCEVAGLQPVDVRPVGQASNLRRDQAEGQEQQEGSC